MDEVTNVAEAKAEIARLKAEKKELAAQKKELAAVKAEEHARWRERQAGRFTGFRSNRSLLGSVVQGGRRGERMEHANRINRLGEQQAALDSQIRELDQGIRDLEAIVRESGPAARVPAAKAPAKGSAEARMQTLTNLRTAGLIDEKEYAAKRAEILASL